MDAYFGQTQTDKAKSKANNERQRQAGNHYGKQ
jgi:hypothetical protein